MSTKKTSVIDQTTNSSTTPTFGQGQSLLDSLVKEYTTGSPYSALENFYGGQLANGGQVDPYIKDVVAGQNSLADTAFADRMKTIRSGGYRGGVNADVMRQGLFTSDFTNRQFTDNSRLFSDAWNNAQGRQFASASGLNNVINSRLGGSTALLGLLRGENTTSSTKGTNVEKSSNPLGTAAGVLGALGALAVGLGPMGLGLFGGAGAATAGAATAGAAGAAGTIAPAAGGSWLSLANTSPYLPKV